MWELVREPLDPHGHAEVVMWSVLVFPTSFPTSVTIWESCGKREIRMIMRKMNPFSHIPTFPT